MCAGNVTVIRLSSLREDGEDKNGITIINGKVTMLVTLSYIDA